MYNRYIPQPDGSYRRKRMEDPTQPPKAADPTPKPVHEPPVDTCALPCPPVSSPPEYRCQTVCPPQSGSNFLRQLLPKDFDAGDLIVIVLLLLIAGDCETERSHALLTLALYFCM